jgi:hypothetical protein
MSYREMDNLKRMELCHAHAIARRLDELGYTCGVAPYGDFGRVMILPQEEPEIRLALTTVITDLGLAAHFNPDFELIGKADLQ